MIFLVPNFFNLVPTINITNVMQCLLSNHPLSEAFSIQKVFYNSKVIIIQKVLIIECVKIVISCKYVIEFQMDTFYQRKNFVHQENLQSIKRLMRLKCLVFWTRNVQPSTTNHVMVLPTITVRSLQLSNHPNHHVFIQIPLTKVSF